MKVCNQCKKNYYDETLEFCLEDGSRLSKIDSKTNEVLTAMSIKPSDFSTQTETVFLDKASETRRSDLPETQPQILQTITQKKDHLKQNVANTSQRFLEISPIVLALAHNYWQWLYLSKQSLSPLSAFLSSYSFIVWFLLFLSGLIFGIFSLKYSKNTGFAITALVVLAINLILSIVPR